MVKHNIDRSLEDKFQEIIKIIFQSICLLSAIILLSWCYYKYTLDKDVSSLSYKFFNQDENSIFPSISICVVNPYIEEKLKRYGGDVNSSSYAEYLMGRYWSENMTTIDHDIVNIDFQDFLKDVFIRLSNGTQKVSSIDGKDSLIPAFYVGYSSAIIKCFTFDMPYIKDVQISVFQLTIDKKIFPRSIRPSRVMRPMHQLGRWEGFGISFHYPGQQLRSFSKEMYSWPSQKGNGENSFAMLYRLSSMEVWKRRNKPKKPCSEDKKNDDIHVLDRITMEVGCRPPFWTSSSKLKICTLKKEFEKINSFMVNVLQLDSQYQLYPCQIIHNLQIDFEEYDLSNGQKLNDVFMVEVTQGVAYYKEIDQVRAYDEETLIGNSGGYVGLFLGCSLLQVRNAFVF